MIVPGPQPTSSRRSPGAQVREEIAGRVLGGPPAMAAQHRLVVAVGVDVVAHRLAIVAQRRSSSGRPVDYASAAMDPSGRQSGRTCPTTGSTRPTGSRCRGRGRRNGWRRPQLLDRHGLGAGRPHALPVWGVWGDDELRFAFSCGPRSRKAANLAANPQARRRLRGHGRVPVARGPGRRCRRRPAGGVDRSLPRQVHRRWRRTLSADFLRQNLVFEVVPERALAIIEREDEFATRATRWRFPSAG